MKLQARLMLLVLLMTAAVLTTAFGLLMNVRAQNAEAAGLTTAKAVADVVVTLRKNYTAHVVAKVRDHSGGAIGINYDFATNPKPTIPLPASMVKFLGETMAKESRGASIRLYSKWPFPNRSGKEIEMDAFERYAMEEFLTRQAKRQSLTTPIHEVDLNAGVIRYAVADLMQEACLGCHNNRPDSPTNAKNPSADPKNHRVWQVGDVRGVVEVVVPLSELNNTMTKSSITVITWVGGVSLLFLVIVLVFAQRTMVNPLLALAEVSGQAQQGDFRTVDKLGTFASRGDEIGILAKANAETLDRLRKALAELKETADQIATAAAESKDSPGGKRIARAIEVQREILGRFTL